MQFMLRATLYTAMLYSCTAMAAVVARDIREKTIKPPVFLLAGDSTTAVQSDNGGGWGDGFLNTTLHNGATGTNYGHNGATTVSFRSGGDWATVLAAAKASKKAYSPYITIQFGHNDQKPEKNISTAQFTANLIQFVAEARAVPATPILVTSLSRRKFSNTTGKVKEDLADVVAATKEAAKRTGAAVIDLNKASMEYLNAIGADEAVRYNLKEGDYTHLNDGGSVVFGNLVAVLLRKEGKGEGLDLGEYVKPVKEIEEALKKGEFYFPEG